MQHESAAPPAGAEHTIKIRDRRLRFGEPEDFAAACSCGWAGEDRRGHTAERDARWDGRRHAESARAGDC